MANRPKWQLVKFTGETYRNREGREVKKRINVAPGWDTKFGGIMVKIPNGISVTGDVM